MPDPDAIIRSEYESSKQINSDDGGDEEIDGIDDFSLDEGDD